MARKALGSVRCSFCGKASEEVEKMITGPGVQICNECVGTCNTILVDSVKKPSDEFSLDELPTPKEMKEFLDQYIIGQDSVKIGVCVAAYNHYKRLHSRTDTGSEVELDKSNILLLGPTGTGKTLVAQTLAKLLKVPFTIVDATIFTEAGYVGEDVENMLVRLLQASDYDVAKAQRGIIYIDEFDKIARKSGGNPSITRDVSGEGVQQAMLKILEGTVASIPPKGGRKHPEQTMIQIDTRDILFVCGGAFVGLEEIVEKRLDTSRMGFTGGLRNKADRKLGPLFRAAEPDDIIQYGLIPELIGRVPVILGLDELDEASLLRILSEPKNALVRQYKKIFDYEDVRLTFTPEALNEVVKIAIEKKTGARGLRNVLENALIPVMFDIPSRDDVREIVVSGEVIRKKAEPVYITKKVKKAAA